MEFRFIVVDINRDKEEEPNVVVTGNNGDVVFRCCFSANLVPNHIGLLVPNFRR